MTPRWVPNKRCAVGWQRWFEWRRTGALPPCCYCGCRLDIPVDVDQNHLTAATREHSLPKSRGGHADAWACLRCNRDKAALTVNEYRAVLIVRHGRPVRFYFETQYPTNMIGIVRVWAAQMCLWLMTHACK